MSEFRKLDNEPKHRDGNVVLDNGVMVCHGDGTPVVVKYDKWLDELSQMPTAKLEAWAKRQAKTKPAKPAEPDEDEAGDGEAEEAEEAEV